MRDSVEAMRIVTHSIDPTVPKTGSSPRWKAVAAGSRSDSSDIEERILAALDRLRAAGIRTALVSDAGADDVECWERSPLCERLDAVVFSYEVGVRKPDPRIYQRALDAIDASPGAAIFVGDGGSDEHRGARAVGMKTVLVTRLAARWWPETIAARRAHVDWEFEDVPAFVAALGL